MPQVQRRELGKMMQRRGSVVALAALLLVLIAIRHPSAELRINLHDATDLAPAKVAAAVDTGLVAVSVLVTWTRRIAR